MGKINPPKDFLQPASILAEKRGQSEQLYASKYISFRKSALFMVIGVAVFVIYLYFFIGSSQILLVLRNINLKQYALFYSLAILSVLASVFCWSAAWNNILKQLSINISYRRSYLYYWVGNFADLIVPCATVCGEVTRLYLVQKETGENYGAIGASAVTNRIIAYSVVTTGLAVGSVFVFLKANVPPFIGNLFILLLLGSISYLAVLLSLAFFRSAAGKIAKLYFIVNKRIRPGRSTADDLSKTQQMLAGFYDGFKVFRENPRALIKPFIFHTLAYILGLSVYVFVFYALGIPAASPVFYIVVYFVATAFQDALASFSVGSLDILLATIFILYGINPASSGVAAVFVRSASFWFPLFVSFICVQIMGARTLLASKLKDPQKTISDRKITDKPKVLSEQQETPAQQQ